MKVVTSYPGMVEAIRRVGHEPVLVEAPPTKSAAEELREQGVTPPLPLFRGCIVCDPAACPDARKKSNGCQL